MWKGHVENLSYLPSSKIVLAHSFLRALLVSPQCLSLQIAGDASGMGNLPDPQKVIELLRVIGTPKTTMANVWALIA